MQTIAELKEQCRVIMMEHLESKGYPDMTYKAIMHEVLPMWMKLEAADLTTPLAEAGFTYVEFANAAVAKYQEAVILEGLSEFAQRIRRHK